MRGKEKSKSERRKELAELRQQISRMQQRISEQSLAQKILQEAHGELERLNRDRSEKLTKVEEKLKLEVAERKKAVEARHKSERRYLELLEKASDLIQSITPNGRFVFVNSVWLDTLGYPKEEVNKLSIFDVIHPDFRAHFREILSKLLAGEAHEKLEVQYVTKQGEKLIFEGSFSCKVIQGEPIVVRAILRNITERRRQVYRLAILNKCFLQFSTDPGENIRRLVSVCGELLEATYALYYRSGQPLIAAPHTWLMFPEINHRNSPEGLLCYDLVLRQSEDVFIVRDLQKSTYAQIDENVRALSLKTYVGRSIRFRNAGVGALCLVYQKDIIPQKEDKWLLGVIAAAITEEEERRWAEEALKNRIEFERLIIDISTQFINLLPEEIDGGIDRALQEIGQFVGADSSIVSLWYKNTFVNSHRWMDTSMVDRGLDLYNIPIEKNKWFMKNLAEMRDVFITSVSGLPAEQKNVKTILQRHNIQSLVIVPLQRGNKLIGFLGFVSQQTRTSWSKDTIALFRMVGHVIENALQRKRSETALRKSEEKYRNLFTESRDAIFIAGHEGQFVDVNQAMLDMFGYCRSEMNTKKVADLFADRRVRHKFQKEVVSKGSVRNFEMIFRRKDDTEMVCLLSATVRRNNKGSIVGYQSIIRDITRQKQKEEEIIKADKLESIGVLAGGIAHDFNNILTGIMNNISLAKLNKANAGNRLAEAEKAVNRAKSLTQQLLTFAKGGAPVKKAAPIAELVAETARFALRGSNVRSQFVLSKHLWDVEFDVDQMSQVIHNLIINANQAMPKGGIIQIRAENLKIDSDGILPLAEGKYVKISITDEGIGIPYSNYKKIFDPYFTTKENGNGLGLATCYSIIKKHNGHLTVESTIDVGSTFHIFLPASKAQKRTGIDTDKKLRLGNGRILVVDDEKSIRSSVKEALHHLGYEGVCVANGAEAIDKFIKARQSGRPFKAVIMDLTIPGGLGGVEINKKLRKIDTEVKTIVSSGYSNDPAMSEYSKYGFKGVIAKPYKIYEMSDVLYQVLNS